MSINEYEIWYDENCQIYDDLRKFVEKSLKTIFDEEGLVRGTDYVLLTSRLKCRRNFLQKIYKEDEKGNRKYLGPNQITDLAGIRIVAFLISDAKILCNVVERYFDVDDERTVKPSDRLGKNLMGYRSSNYVVKLGEDYFVKLQKYQLFKDIHFEIQVATLLDFTWMEIEHDRVYKTAHNFH